MPRARRAYSRTHACSQQGTFAPDGVPIGKPSLAPRNITVRSGWTPRADARACAGQLNMNGLEIPVEMCASLRTVIGPRRASRCLRSPSMIWIIESPVASTRSRREAGRTTSTRLMIAPNAVTVSGWRPGRRGRSVTEPRTWPAASVTGTHRRAGRPCSLLHTVACTAPCCQRSVTRTVTGRRARGRIGRNATVRRPAHDGVCTEVPTVCDVPSGPTNVAVNTGVGVSQRHGAARGRSITPLAGSTADATATGPAAVVSVTVTVAPGVPVRCSATNPVCRVDALTAGADARASAAATAMSGRTQHHRTARRVIDRCGLLHTSFTPNRQRDELLTLASSRRIRRPSARHRGLSLRRVRRVLPGRAGALLVADAAPARLEGVHPGGELRLLRRRRLALLRPASRGDGGQPGGRAPGREGGLRPREEHDRHGDGRLGPARARLLQVLRLLRLQRRRAAAGRRARRPGSAPGGGPAGRAVVLHVPGDQLHRRRPARHLRARDDGRPGDLPVVLPASGRRPDRPRARVPPAAAHAARPA